MYTDRAAVLRKEANPGEDAENSETLGGEGSRYTQNPPFLLGEVFDDGSTPGLADFKKVEITLAASGLALHQSKGVAEKPGTKTEALKSPS
ncbi:hypothetical protein JCM33374_g6613 [Metschnikowia sp. JCM 33374]|nr:hypothetical protein JCM33374_g6613 [Metschnikowia sp. JCM 33374]